MSDYTLSGTATGQFQAISSVHIAGARPRRWHDEARELRAQGLTYREIGQRVGKSTAGVHRYLNRDPNAETVSHVRAKASWRAAAMDMLRAGYTLQETGDKFGVTRERVRQIAAEEGVESIRCRAVANREAAAIADLIDEGMTVAEIAAHTGRAAGKVRRIGSSRRPDRLVANAFRRRLDELESYLERVRGGESYRSAAGRNHSIAAKIHHVMKKQGVSRPIGRWFPEELRQKRLAFIRAGRRDGDSWAVIAKKISTAEGKRVTVASATAYAKKHCPEVFTLARR